MIFRYFTHAFVDQFAQQSVDQFEATELAPETVAKRMRDQTKHTEKVDRALERMMTNVQRFTTEHRLNVFQRARLAQQLQNRLIKIGHPVRLARGIATTVFAMRIRE